MSDDEKQLRKAKQQERAQRKAGLNVDQLVVAPQRHISVDASELKAALRSRLPMEERPDFDDLCKLVEGVASFDFWDLKRRMREEFLPFASGAKNQTYLQRSSRPLPSTVNLDSKEEDFIADVYEVLRASHYHLLTAEEWEIATAEDFQLSLPVEVNWEYMDNQMLTKFWASDPEYQEIRQQLPDELADRILVFHRWAHRRPPAAWTDRVITSSSTCSWHSPTVFPARQEGRAVPCKHPPAADTPACRSGPALQANTPVTHTSCPAAALHAPPF
jgi:hypothetical protein